MNKQQIVYVKLSDIKPYKNNAKKHSKEQVEKLAKSIKEFGFKSVVVLDKNNEVIAGHGRCYAAKKAGLKEIPCIYADDLTDEQIKAYRLIDNKLNESDWDKDILDSELDNIFDIDMEGFGFSFDVSEDNEISVEPEIPFTEILNEENNYIVLKFNNKVDWINAMGLLGIKKVKAYSTSKKGNVKEFGDRAGVGRVIDGVEAINRMKGDE